MLNSNEIKVLVLLETGVTMYSRIKDHSKLESIQVTRALKKLVSLGSAKKNGEGKEVFYSITKKGNEALKEELQKLHEFHATKAIQYKKLSEKLS